MANKILTVDELSQKFLDNASNHKGIPTNSFNEATLDGVKNGINTCWGLNMSEANRCVCCDYDEMNSNSSDGWGASGTTVMAEFWQKVYNTTSIQGIVTDEDVISSQITMPNDKQLLDEGNVDVLGCCVNLANTMPDLTVTTAGITSATTVNLRVYPIVKENQAGTHGLMYVVKNNEKLNYTSPVTQYYDVNDNENITWKMELLLNYPTGTYFNQIDTNKLIIDNVYNTRFYLSGSTGNTSTTLTTSISKTINDFINIKSILISDLSMGYNDAYIYLDVTNCYIMTSTNTKISISGATYIPNALNSCIFCTLPGLRDDASAKRISGYVKYDNNRLKIGIDTDNMDSLGTTTSYYLWADFQTDVNGTSITAWYCFNVSVSYTDTWNISLASNECLIDLDGGNVGTMYCMASLANGKTVTINRNGGNNVILSNGSTYLDSALNNFVPNKINVTTSLGNGSFRFNNNGQYTQLGSIPGTINLIYGYQYGSVTSLFAAMLNSNLKYDIYLV